MVPGGTQIKDGDALEQLDLESYWCDHKTGEVALRQGEDFDQVVLAIPAGSWHSTH